MRKLYTLQNFIENFIAYFFTYLKIKECIFFRSRNTLTNTTITSVVYLVLKNPSTFEREWALHLSLRWFNLASTANFFL